MSKLLYLSLIAFISCNVAGAQSGEKPTTFILLRHAEKAANQSAMTTGNDPKLSEDGLKRAERLSELFSRASIDAIYSTNYERTRNTVIPLAKAKSLEIQNYEPGKPEEIDRIWSESKGKTVVICGHSNTIPKIANYLSGTNDYKDFDDSDYGNIIIISTAQKGNPASITWLRY